MLQLVSILALALSRALNVWPNAALVNYVRPPDLRIPQSQQFMVWFSGMRGAMAFAMVLRALEDLPGSLTAAFLRTAKSSAVIVRGRRQSVHTVVRSGRQAVHLWTEPPLFSRVGCWTCSGGGARAAGGDVLHHPDHGAGQRRRRRHGDAAPETARRGRR